MSQILIRPIITEKMTAQCEKENRYGFVVARESNKLDIRAAVKKQFNVEVESVRTMIVRGKKRTRYSKTNILRGTSSSYKKAIVTLKKGETIDLYSSI